MAGIQPRLRQAATSARISLCLIGHNAICPSVFRSLDSSNPYATRQRLPELGLAARTNNAAACPTILDHHVKA